ncbi:uncharacterized protein LOC116017362 isoform X1 [Ipomoea triloba]|uniref:uncharacterized protein LOC116017362 isoform X1 n=1 Tax=Ipomoea triloba TaxID=35885 RepID=UPI00125CE9B3|nr:uncharacterized protein LOC116017362 isoform X1 [Ipomoea triloba]
MDRNLIILSKLSSCGRKIKRFRMHDLLHAFCRREAQNENLLHVVQSKNSSYFPQKGFRWVNIQYENFDVSRIHHFTWKSCRSFFSFVRRELNPDFRNVNLLRVLFRYTSYVRIKNNVNTVHLRFLDVENSIELSRTHGFLESRGREGVELSRSWNLQTLYCYRRVSFRRLDEGGKYLKFPQLQHILCLDPFCGNPPNFVHKVGLIRDDDCSKEWITNIPCLKKVHIACEGSKINACIANLAYLEQLEGLKILYSGNTRNVINNSIALLKNLRKLTLYGVGFVCDEKINIRSKLPRLEVLKLHWKPFVGKEWEIQEEVIFCQLIALVIYGYHLKHWKASSQNFPKLGHLYIKYSYKLREIPIGFAEISTLKSIKLWECLPSAVESAKKIQEEQRDYGNNDMVVIKEHTFDGWASEESLSEEETEVDN